MGYWLVGASWGGIDHQDKKFVERGYWMLGWDENNQPKQFEKGLRIQEGDRIAIKRMKGRDQSGIRILH